MPNSRTTPTSYALLGLLALRPWTAYELAQQITRSMRFFWPRSAAHVYSEMKRLEQLGLAAGTVEHHGHRPRTSYVITEPGRRALTSWLATPPGAPQLEIEGLLRLLHADHGTKHDLLQAIDATREAMWVTYSDGAEQVRGYLAGGGPFPERLHIIGLLAMFYADFAEAVLDWCDLAEREVHGWPETAGVGLTEATKHHLEDILRRYEQRRAARQAAATVPAGPPTGPV